jgi:hypothetical protein
MSTQPTDTLLSYLDRVKQTGPNRWLASCSGPLHENGDRNPSLSIRETDDGGVLLHCFFGCDYAQILAAIDLKPADLYPQQADARGSRPKPQRIPWRDVFDAIRCDLRVCSIAFCDLAAGKEFSPDDVKTIARLANHLADQIQEVANVRS